MIRVTADTNIYISAFQFGGVPKEVLGLAQDGEIHLAVSHYILDEMARTLRNKFNWPSIRISTIQAQLLSYTELITPTIRIEAVPNDPTDNRILECAVASRSEFLVTGDKHLLRLGQHEEIRILPPAGFLEILSARP